MMMFIDRMTGYVYGYNIENGLTYQISNTTLPGIYDAYIFDSGKQILLRYLDNDKQTILSLLARIPAVQETGNALPLQSIMSLQKNISSVAISSSGNKLSYLVPNKNGSSVYTITDKGESLTTSSSFSEWSLSYGGEQLFATSKPSAYIEGTTVLIPSFTRLIGNKTGLVSNPSSNGAIINSMLSNKGLLTFLFSNKGDTKVLEIKTIASKCSWGRGTLLLCAVPQSITRGVEELPDDWYQGRVKFKDDLYIININNGEKTALYSFEEKDGDMDIVHMHISSDNTLINFTRKQDGSLWLLNTNLMQVD